MSDLVTLVHRMRGLPEAVVPAAGVRHMQPTDLRPVAELYFAAYEPGEACSSLEEALADTQASFDGKYGEFWWDGSFVHESQGRVAAAVMTVRRAPWDDTPDGPFIIELFTDPDHRRRHLARDLVELVLVEASAQGESVVGLRVSSDNDAAIRLYRGLGFVD